MVQSTKSNRVKILPAPPPRHPEATTESNGFLYILSEMVHIYTFYSRFFHINDNILYTLFCTSFFS